MQTITGKIIGVLNNGVWNYVREVEHKTSNIMLTVSDLVVDITEATIFTDMNKIKEYLKADQNIKVFDATITVDSDTQQDTADLPKIKGYIIQVKRDDKILYLKYQFNHSLQMGLTDLILCIKDGTIFDNLVDAECATALLKKKFGSDIETNIYEVELSAIKII